MSESNRRRAMIHSTERIQALSDGVFSIVMTLLVFEITLPEGNVDLLAALFDLRYSFIGYAVSFVLLGIYWLGHRSQFNFIREADSTLHWLNILFLACSAFVPFSTGLLSRYPQDRLALVIYGGNLIAIGLALYWHWAYATKERRLVDDDLSPAIIRYGAQRCLLAPLGYLLAIGIAFITPTFGLIVYILIPLLYIVPPIQRTWWAFANRS